MNAGMPSRPDRPDRFERVVRGMLALALLAGVVWAVAHSGAAPGFDFRNVLG